MDSLASYIANKRTDTKKEFGGKKYVKRGELEEARLKKRLEEESATEQKRVRKLYFDANGHPDWSRNLSCLSYVPICVSFLVNQRHSVCKGSQCFVAQ